MEPENENTPPDPKSDLHTASTGWFRSKSDVNQDLPIEQFRRLIGLYYSIPEKTRYSEKYLSVSKAFEHLRDVIEQTLGASDKDQASIDTIKFIKYDTPEP